MNGGGADAPSVPRGCGKTQALEGPLISCASCPVTLLYVCALLKRTSKNALNTLLGEPDDRERQEVAGGYYL